MGRLRLPLRKPIARRKLTRFMRRAGWTVRRNGTGDHEIWIYTNGCQLVLPVRTGNTQIGQPFLRQINQAMQDGEIQSRGRQPSSRATIQ